MARYIDADLEVSKYVTVWDCDCSEFGKQTVMAVDDLHYLPTADVAPRAEVAREIFRDVRNILNKHYYDCYQYEDGDECDAVITYLSYVAVDFDEIEKKYTQSEPPKGD